MSQCWLKALEIYPISLGSVCFSNVYRHESGRCHSLSFILIYFYHFTFPGFPFILLFLFDVLSLLITYLKTLVDYIVTIIILPEHNYFFFNLSFFFFSTSSPCLLALGQRFDTYLKSMISECSKNVHFCR